MQVTKCDICKKTISKGHKSVWVSLGGAFGSPRAEMCPKCASPVLNFLKSKKIIKDEKASKKIK